MRSSTNGPRTWQVIFWDPNTLLHNTVELLGSKLIPALESPARIEAIMKGLRRGSTDQDLELRMVNFSVTQSSDQLAQLLATASQNHSLEYLTHLRDIFEAWTKAGLIKHDGHVLPECFPLPTKTGKIQGPPRDAFARAGFYAFDMSSGIMSDSYRAIIASAHLAMQSTTILLNRPTDNPKFMLDAIFALCRPPGHHCDGHRAGGYCYINNAALSVATYRDKFPNAKVGILDIDFHHGNGTQEIFWDDPRTMYVSVHGDREFPYYTGSEEETGGPNATNTNVNLPLPVGASLEEYLEKLNMGIARLVDFDIEFLVVSLGFDTYHADPLGYFQIHTEDYHTIAKTVRSQLKDMLAVVVLEGGYALDSLSPNFNAFTTGWRMGSN
jgi:acetoin utilization deacetylase AcuC-like enzyme